MVMAKSGCVGHGRMFAPWRNYTYMGTVTIGASGAVTASSFPGAVKPDGSALFTVARTSIGLYTFSVPTGSYGHPIVTIDSDNIDVCRVGAGDYDPTTGVLLVNTLEDDAVTGIPALADPASGDIIRLTLMVHD